MMETSSDLEKQQLLLPQPVALGKPVSKDVYPHLRPSDTEATYNYLTPVVNPAHEDGTKGPNPYSMERTESMASVY